MSKEDKKKDKKKEKKKDKKKKNQFLLSPDGKNTENFKSKCCAKYEKGENKRCKRCPMFDLTQKAS